MEVETSDIRWSDVRHQSVTRKFRFLSDAKQPGAWSLERVLGFARLMEIKTSDDQTVRRKSSQ